MGNKHGKFNVPASTEANGVNKEEIAVIEDPEHKTEESPVTEANGCDVVVAETANVEESAPQDAPKKKNVISWLKKVSMRKEKKSKVSKQNGVKDEVKENGDVEEVKEIEEEKVVEESPKEEVITNGHCETKEEIVNGEEETIEEVPKLNGHAEHHVEETEASTPVDDQQ